MKIEIARHSGFCFGVKRAMKMIDRTLQNNGNGKVWTLGPIIHNSQVVERLKDRGLGVIESLARIKSGKVFIRCHGVSPKLLKEYGNRKLKIIDATCPFVKNSHRIAESLNRNGYALIIVGDKNHPEIKSTMGFFDGDVTVIKDEKEAARIKLKGRRFGVIAQTTQAVENYSKVICELMKRDFLEMRIYNTICPDTVKRQSSCREIARGSSIMLIVGGKNSANTKRLFEICNQMRVKSYHIEDASQIDPAWVKSNPKKDRPSPFHIREGSNYKVGIISGASTPEWIVNGVINRLKEIDKGKILQIRTKVR